MPQRKKDTVSASIDEVEITRDNAIRISGCPLQHKGKYFIVPFFTRPDLDKNIVTFVHIDAKRNICED